VITSAFNQRLQDLADNVDKDFKLLKEFEDVLCYETNPRVKAGYCLDIEQLRESASRYQQEYEGLKQQVAANEPIAKMQNIETQLHHMDAKLNLLLNAQDAISTSLNQMRQSLLKRYGAAEEVMIASIVQQLSQNQLAMIQTLLDALEANQLSEPEMQQMLAVLEKRIPYLLPNQAAVARDS
jgi:vacuolar-type H+-ATPase subunit I/STV1